MKKLAIQGHETRGKEVIELLKMLGGENPDGCIGNNELSWYVIGQDSAIRLCTEIPDACRVFTLEEFLEKFPYKVGDKVMASYDGESYIAEVNEMRWSESINEVLYQVGTLYNVKTVDMLPTAHHVGHSSKDMKKVNMKITIELPEGFEFRDENGNIINAQKIMRVKKQSQYPKTYEECSDILEVYTDPDIDGYKNELLWTFQKLLVCRDAYWKIAGDWKADWRIDVDSCNTFKFCINYYENEIRKMMTLGANAILAFPTEEMRDAFFENFKDLIEECKELL